MPADSLGLLNTEVDDLYSPEEIAERYVAARLNYLRSGDPIASFFHGTDALYFRRIGKYNSKKLGELRASAYKLLKSHTN